jgi:hypothetical protein
MPDDNRLHVQIVREVFGWQWDPDRQAWYPPEWPPYSVVNPAYDEKRQALRRHGGIASNSGGTDERGRPIIPAYQYHPEATMILWDWLYAQPWLRRLEFMPLPLPPGSLEGAQHWRCEIALAGDVLVHGEGGGHAEALCRAVLAVAAARAGQPLR